MSDHLQLEVQAPGPMAPPQDRGCLLTPEEVAEIVKRSPGWCRRHIPHKLTLGHSTVRWYAADVRAWLETQRDDPCTA